MWKLQIRPNGSFYCFRCSKKGGLSDLKNKFELYSHFDGHILNSNRREEFLTSSSETHSTHDESLSYVIPDQSRMISYQENLFPTSNLLPKVNSVIEESRERVLEYLLSKRGLNKESLVKYSVGFTVQQFLSDEKKTWVDHVCVTFPWIRQWCVNVGENEGEDNDNVSIFIIGVEIIVRVMSGLTSKQIEKSEEPDDDETPTPTIVRMKFRFYKRLACIH